MQINVEYFLGTNQYWSMRVKVQIRYHDWHR